MAWEHKLTDKNLASMTGVCSHCGPVELAWRSGGRPGAPRVACCAVAKKEGRRKQHERNPGDRAAWLYTNRNAGHGLTVEEARRAREGKACALCGTEEDLAVDHCHATGQRRGVLCKRHNSGLGFFQDDPILLRAAADYIEMHREMSADCEIP